MTRCSLVVAVLLLATVAHARPHRRHARAAPEDVGGDDRDDDRADSPDDLEGDGPEARAMLPTRLDDLIANAVRQSPDLARAKADRSIARDAAAGEGRSQAWILSSHAEYARDGLADHVDAAPFTVVAEDKLSGGVGLGRNLPSGGSVSLELGLERLNQELNILDNLKAATSQATTSPTGTDPKGNPYEYLLRSQASVTATYKQPLSRGLGPDVALAPQRKANLAATEATVKAQLAAEELVRDIVVGYWELAYKSYEVDVRNKALALARAQEQVTHDRMRAGALPSSALDSVTYEIAVRQEAALRSQLELEQASLDLRRKAGLEVGRRDILIRPGDPFVIGNDEFDVDEILALSHRTNHQLATLMLERKIADVDLDVAEDQTKPQVDLSLSGSLLGRAEQPGVALQSLGDHDSFQVSVGLSVSFELSGSARKARDAARTRLHRLDIDRLDLERQLDVQVVAAVHTVTAARTRVALAEKAIDVAEENVRAERANFLVNRTTNFQVMQRQTQLIEARLSRGRAIADYHEAVAKLQFLSGVLLPQYRVNVRPHRRD